MFIIDFYDKGKMVCEKDNPKFVLMNHHLYQFLDIVSHLLYKHGFDVAKNVFTSFFVEFLPKSKHYFGKKEQDVFFGKESKVFYRIYLPLDDAFCDLDSFAKMKEDGFKKLLQASLKKLSKLIGS